MGGYPGFNQPYFPLLVITLRLIISEIEALTKKKKVLVITFILLDLLDNKNINPCVNPYRYLLNENKDRYPESLPENTVDQINLLSNFKISYKKLKVA